MQERIEASYVGRVLISGFLIVTLAVILALNLPYSDVTRRLMPLANLYQAITGVEQAWRLFAPIPRQDIVQWYARIELSDGSVDVWHALDGDPFIGSFRVHRWRKLMQDFVQEAVHGQALESAARYVARRVATDGREPRRVVFVMRALPLRPPGWQGAPGAWEEHAYYAVSLTPALAQDQRR